MCGYFLRIIGMLIESKRIKEGKWLALQAILCIDKEVTIVWGYYIDF